MIFLDTSALIHFFTNDQPQRAVEVRNVLEKEKEIYIPQVVFPELEYVLRGAYGASRNKIVEVFQFLASRSNIKLNQVVKKAFRIYKETKLDIADCLIASHSLKGRLASFDKQLLNLKGVKKY